MATQLQLIKSQTITSSVSTFDVTDVFSGNYDVYKIVTRGISTTGTAATGVKIRLINSSGSVVSTSDYDYAYISMLSSGATSDTRSTNNTYIEEIFGIAYQSPQNANSVVYCYNPFSSSSYTFLNFSASAGQLRAPKGIGVYKQNTSMTGFQILDSTGARPFGSGQIAVYGVK